MALRAIAFIAAGLIFGLSSIAAAHHSGAAYDNQHRRSIAGTVKTVNWTNPHVTYVIETDAKDDQPVQTLVFESTSPGVLTVPVGPSGRCSRATMPSFTMRPCATATPVAFCGKLLCRMDKSSASQ
jgi:hypothetical protein